MKTLFPGKDAALQDTIERFQAQLTAHGFNLANIDNAAWHNPIPNVWSVQIQDADASMNVTMGKGTSQDAALASALGKLIERLATNDFYANRYLGEAIATGEFVHYPNEKWFPIDLEENLPPEGILDERLTQFYDPTLELLGTDLIDLQSSNMARGICTLPFERQGDSEMVNMPVNIIGNLYTTNGIAAGNSKAEARNHALCEIIERHIKNRILAKQTRLPAIPESVLSRFTSINESIDALEAHGFDVQGYDASLGGKYPVVCVALSHQDSNIRLASFASHTSIELALERAVTELVQGHNIDELKAQMDPSVVGEAGNEHFTPESLLAESTGLIASAQLETESATELADWSFGGNSEEQFNHLMGLLHAEGADVYIADYDHLGVDCCRIIVPGWSEVAPVDDLIEANNNVALELREVLLALPAVEWDEEQFAEMFHIVEEEFDDDALLHRMLGLETQAGDAWQTLRVGELKCLIALAGGDLELALDFAKWSVAFNTSMYSAERMNFFRCLIDSLQLAIEEEQDPADCKADFESRFGSETVAAAWGSIEGSVQFYGLTAGNLTMSQFPAHQQLLQSYHKLQVAKKAKYC
ncbi:YcaO-like family protein [Photobacterium sp. BZF1]|uniref:YcaO-like family protein n=1 Tax=Photobacterium sp. BZF1 TaxID=1904457 RepID=UPI001653CB46|nr:YcaO-like family protein [Photobacterium sp. BZF1]MBC7005025.1 YcaO-like family protein [Photobacterium sp. BZF1]